MILWIGNFFIGNTFVKLNIFFIIDHRTSIKTEGKSKRSRRPEHKEADEKKSQKIQSKPKPQEAEPKKFRNGNGSVKGMGDHIPAFMMRDTSGA
mgnify:CR=1 FL=1